MLKNLISINIIIFILASCSAESITKINSKKNMKNKISNVTLGTSKITSVTITE